MHKRILSLMGPLDKDGNSLTLLARVKWSHGENPIEEPMTLEDVFDYLFDLIEEQGQEIQMLKNRHLKFGERG